MTITDFLGLLGGLALFLYGMQMMGNGLEAGLQFLYYLLGPYDGRQDGIRNAQ